MIFFIKTEQNRLQNHSKPVHGDNVNDFESLRGKMCGYGVWEENSNSDDSSER